MTCGLEGSLTALWKREWKGARAKSGKNSDSVEAGSAEIIYSGQTLIKLVPLEESLPVAAGWRWGKNWTGRSFQRLLSSLKLEIKRGLQ